MSAGDAPAPASDGAFVEAIMTVQGLVSRGAAPALIYQAVVDGAIGLLHGDSGSLRFRDLDDPDWTVAVAWHRSAGEGERWRHRAPVSEGISGLVIATGEEAVVEDYESAALGSQLAPPGTNAIIGVPIREQQQVIGSLTVGSTLRGRQWSEQERRMLREYADNVGVAVTVVRASNALQQALTDSLTGLANRRLLLERLQRELVRADRGGIPPTLLFMDLDGFKLVNDSLGHSVGDQLLVAVAERLKGCVRDGDVAARVGGDEFAVLLLGHSDPEALAKRIIDALGRRYQIGANEVFVGVSVGIVRGRDDAETLLRHADVAMYHAKRSTTSSYAQFEPRMQAARSSRLKLDGELRRAIDRAEFELHYQPLYDLRSGRIAAVEGLVRWRHPERGLVAPLDFIPFAEEAGLIVDIGRWVLEHGAAQLAIWWRDTPVAMSVNASTRELARADYADGVRRALAGGAFPPSALILEVTEREPLEDVPGVIESLHAVSELGARLALDDFGTGYSTLVNLAHLPIDILKIAKPFVDTPGRDGSPVGLLGGIIALGQHLGLTTVAEGIEQPEQRALLIELGCDLGQGYFFGRPIDAAQTTELLAADFAHADAGTLSRSGA